MDNYDEVDGRGFATARTGRVGGMERDATSNESAGMRSKRRKVLKMDEGREMEEETATKDRQASLVEEKKNKCLQCLLSNSDQTHDTSPTNGSCMAVEEWMEHCDAAAVIHGKNADGVSNVFTIGGVLQRPQPDVGAWKRRRKDEHPRADSFAPRRKERSPISDNHPTSGAGHSHSIDQNSNEQPASTILHGQIPKKKVNIIEKLISALYSKKSEMTPMDMEQEPKMQDSQQPQCVRFEEKPGPRRRVRREKFNLQVKSSAEVESTRRVSAVSHHEKLPDRHSYISAGAAGPSKEVDHRFEDWESDADSVSSILSSRMSEINLGSILGQPNSPPVYTSRIEESRPQMDPQQFKPSPPRSILSRQSSSRSQSRMTLAARRRSMPSQDTAASSSSSWHVGAVQDSFTSFAPPTCARSNIDTDFTNNRERRRQERNSSAPTSVVKEPDHSLRSQQDRRTSLPMAKDLRTRRAERSRRSATEKYHRDERERFWSSEKLLGGMQE